MINANNYSEPKRLHPLTLLYSAIVNSPALLIPLYLGISKGISEEYFFLIISIMILFFTLPSILLVYYFFKFQITNNELVIYSGVIAKKQKNIPIKRIQNVNIEQNFLQRILGLAKVQIETAGEATAEAVLQFVSKKDAQEIIDVIKYRQDSETNSENNKPTVSKIFENFDVRKNIVDSNDDNAQEIFSLSNSKILLYGLLRFRPVALILGIWIYTNLQQFFTIPELTEDFIDSNLKYLQNLNTVGVVFYIAMFILIVFVSSIIIDCLLTFNKYYNFRLIKDKNKFITNFGLFTKRNVTIPLKKLQSIVITTNPIKKLVNFYSLGLLTAGIGSSVTKDVIAVPIASLQEVTELAQNIRKFVFPQEFKKVSKKTIRRAIFRYFIFFIPIVALLFWVSSTWLWLLIIAPVLFWAAVLRWEYRGYYIDADLVFVKQGFWFQKVSIVPIEKIQSIVVNETFFQRRLGLATLHIDTAAGILVNDCSIVDIDANDAEEISNLLMTEFKRIIKKN